MINCQMRSIRFDLGPVRLEDASMTSTALQAEIKSLDHGGERCKI